MTRIVHQALPGESGRPGDLARQLLRLLGPAWQAPDGSVTAVDMLALGDALDALLDSLEGALDEAFPDTVTEMLDEWEAALALPSLPSQSVATRRTAILAATRAGFAGSPQAILAAIQTLVPGATLLEPYAPQPDPRRVFRLFVGLGSSYDDIETRTRVSAVLVRMQPAYAGHTLVSSTNFKCDDSLSLCDRDVLGV